MKKAELREQYLKERKAFSKLHLTEFSCAIMEQLKTVIPFSEITTIHLFLPIENQAEIDLWEFIHWIWKTYPSIQLVVPVCDFKTRTMKTCLLTPSTTLRYDNYNIPEPIEATEIPNSTIDLVITPLVVCDTLGYRVGYGKGFYDTFFSSCKPNIQKIGIGLFDLVSPIEDVDDWDIPLNHYITPKGFTSFQ